MGIGKRDTAIFLAAIALTVLGVVRVFYESAVPTAAWGLSFRQEGTAPVGNAGTEQLRQYDAGPPAITVSASYTTYQGALSNLVDDNTSTYWWSGTAQSTGAYVMLTFSASANITAVQVVTTNNTGDCVSSGNKLQYTQDGSTWITVGSFNGSTTCTFSNLGLTGIKALRIYAASSASNWLCINEITVSRTAAAGTVETTAYLRGAGGWAQLTDGSAINGAAITT